MPRVNYSVLTDHSFENSMTSIAFFGSFVQWTLGIIVRACCFHRVVVGSILFFFFFFLFFSFLFFFLFSLSFGQVGTGALL
jgi:hypothetical protein